LDLAKEGIWVARINGKKYNFIFNNKIICNIYETSLEDINKNPTFWESIVHPDDINIIKKATVKCIKNMCAVNLNFRLIFPDGRIKYIEEKRFIHKINKKMYAGGTQQVIRTLLKKTPKIENI
jgi:hypothetical protein